MSSCHQMKIMNRIHTTFTLRSNLPLPGIRAYQAEFFLETDKNKSQNETYYQKYNENICEKMRVTISEAEGGYIT